MHVEVDEPEDESTAGTGRDWQDRLSRLLTRLMMVAGLAWIGYRIPLPVVENWLPFRDVLVAVATVIATGKLLFDTLFYDRYLP